jgi:hypothetical protein
MRTKIPSLFLNSINQLCPPIASVQQLLKKEEEKLYGPLKPVQKRNTKLMVQASPNLQFRIMKTHRAILRKTRPQKRQTNQNLNP